MLQLTTNRLINWHRETSFLLRALVFSTNELINYRTNELAPHTALPSGPFTNQRTSLRLKTTSFSCALAQVQDVAVFLRCLKYSTDERELQAEN
jgi:hypothetical protein